MVKVDNKVCLMCVNALLNRNDATHAVSYSVHDGWGIAPEKGMKGDAIGAADTTNMDTIAKEHSYRTLHAHGIAVGLSDGLMGNSEVGYVAPHSRTADLH